MAKQVEYRFEAVGLDAWDRASGARPHIPADGTAVVKTKVRGAPRNGTMGHCMIAHADTGEFIGLVLENSLQRTFR